MDNDKITITKKEYINLLKAIEELTRLDYIGLWLNDDNPQYNISLMSSVEQTILDEYRESLEKEYK